MPGYLPSQRGRNSPTKESFYDNRRQPAPHLLAKMRSHDPNVQFRWNSALGLLDRATKKPLGDWGRWELWRWRDTNPGRAPTNEERGRRIVFCYVIHNPDGTFRDIDERVIDTIIANDSWAEFGAVTDKDEANRLGAKLDAIDEAEAVRTEAEIATHAEEWSRDHRRQINEFFGHSSPIFVMPGEKKVVLP